MSIFCCLHISGPKPNLYVYRYVSSNRDKVGFYAEIQIIFGPRCTDRSYNAILLLLHEKVENYKKNGGAMVSVVTFRIVAMNNILLKIVRSS